jgi:glycosyltransferase involved in cell wall biosynthesis
MTSLAGNGTSLRVLLVTDSYPPVLGGSEIEAQRFASAMIRRGHQVQVLCSGGSPMPALRDWLDPTGVPVTILARRSTGVQKHWVFAAEVARTLLTRRSDYDLVYFLMQGLHLLTGLAATRLLGKPAVVKISGSGIIPLMQASRAGRIELDWLLKWRVPVMLLNDGMVEEAAAAGFSREDLVWMPNPVDIDEFRPAQPGEIAAWRARHEIPPDALVGIYVGRLSSEKGLTGLLGGFAEAARQVPEALLLLVGDGIQRAELESLAARLNLSPRRVRFVGRVDVKEVPSWLRASDAFALTSPNEGFPCSLVEAMAVGLPSVVSDIAANLQLVDAGVHGLTVPFDDESAIGSAFVTLFRDPELRTAMGRNARTRVIENYATDRVIDRYELLFRQRVLKSGRNA